MFLVRNNYYVAGDLEKVKCWVRECNGNGEAGEKEEEEKGPEFLRPLFAVCLS